MKYYVTFEIKGTYTVAVEAGWKNIDEILIKADDESRKVNFGDVHVIEDDVSTIESEDGQLVETFYE